MADVLWPVGVPESLLIRDLEETTPDLVIRSQPDVGPAIVRRRQTVNVRVLQAAMQLTRAQLETFDGWFLNTVKGGALSFELTNPRTGQKADYRFVERPRYRQRAPRQAGATEIYTVSFVLEELPVPTGGGGGPTPPVEGEAESMLLAIVRPVDGDRPAVDPEDMAGRGQPDILIFFPVVADTTPLNLIDPLPGWHHRIIEDEFADLGDAGRPGGEPPGSGGSGSGPSPGNENPDQPVGPVTPGV